MDPAEQQHRWHACVEAHQGGVIVQVEDKITWLTPRQARRLAYELAGAILRAQGEIAVEPPKVRS